MRKKEKIIIVEPKFDLSRYMKLVDELIEELKELKGKLLKHHYSADKSQA